MSAVGFRPPHNLGGQAPLGSLRPKRPLGFKTHQCAITPQRAPARIGLMSALGQRLPQRVRDGLEPALSARRDAPRELATVRQILRGRYTPAAERLIPTARSRRHPAKESEFKRVQEDSFRFREQLPPFLSCREAAEKQ